jgi:hypothetical protein
VSIEISTRVWKQSRQKGTHKLFLLCLADHANGDGYCYPGIERIAEWCSVNERQGRRISADLQADGEIMVKVGGGRYGTNEYIITAGMDSEELEKTVAKYFKVGKKDAYEMVQELLKKQHDATNKNPVLEDTPVIADQNPVTQDTNPVLEDIRTVINRQEPHTQAKSEKPTQPTPRESAWKELSEVFPMTNGVAWQKFDELWQKFPDPRRHTYAIERARKANPAKLQFYLEDFCSYDPDKPKTWGEGTRPAPSPRYSRNAAPAPNYRTRTD